MVQRQSPLEQQGEYYREGAWSRQDRSPFIDLQQENNRFVTAPAPAPVPAPTSVHVRAQTIEAALKDCVGIDFKAFALIVRLDNGEDKVYSSVSLTNFRDRIFTDKFKQDFRRSIRRAPYPNTAFNQDVFNNVHHFDAETSSGGVYNRKHSSSGGSSTEYGRRTHRKIEDSDENDSFSAKKRRFPSYRQREGSNEDTPVPVSIKKTQQLRIGDRAEVGRFYQTRFKDMQQSSCKVMGKAFVKLVEPKKQTHHPYTKGAEKAPPWWPNTTGENHVRHREPDHLLKPERIRLLVHILRMLILPIHRQDASIQKLELNVKKLEEVTMEAMNNWFNDKDHPDNAQKKPYLKEIFRIARAEERFENGEIDGSTYLSVMYGDRAGTEESDGESDMKPEDNEDEVATSSISVSIPSPDNGISPTTSHNPHMLDENMRIRLPMRQSAHASMDEQAQFNEFATYNSRNMGFHPQSPGMQDRRPYIPIASYSSPQPTLYTNWSSMPMASNGPGQTFYTTSPQQNVPPSGPFLPPPNSQQQQMLPHPVQLPSYDGIQSLGRYDTSPALGNTLRTGSMSHPHAHTQQMPSYDGFLHDNGGYQHDNDLKDEQQQHLHHSQQ